MINIFFESPGGLPSVQHWQPVRFRLSWWPVDIKSKESQRYLSFAPTPSRASPKPKQQLLCWRVWTLTKMWRSVNNPSRSEQEKERWETEDTWWREDLLSSTTKITASSKLSVIFRVWSWFQLTDSTCWSCHQDPILGGKIIISVLKSKLVGI